MPRDRVAAHLCYHRSMTPLAATLFVALAAPGTASPHFDVSATFLRGAGGREEVAVRFVGADPDVRINEAPPPKLRLEAGSVLVEKPSPQAKKAGEGKYFDLTLPVAFPVATAAGAARGAHMVRGSVTYFYCSKREGWCRKGVADLSFPVTVP